MSRRAAEVPAPVGAALMSVHPAGLGDGTRIGDWRVLWRHELGTFGVVYLAVRVGQEAAGACALKLALAPGPRPAAPLPGRVRADAGLPRQLISPHQVHHAREHHHTPRHEVPSREERLMGKNAAPPCGCGGNSGGRWTTM